jgi:1-phosphofructokinase
VSLGPDGAVLVERDVVLHGVAPVRRVVNTVGAGDAFLAGYLSSGRRAPRPGDGDGDARHALTRALRYAAAAVQHEGTLISGPDETVEVLVTTCDRSRALRHPVSPPSRFAAPPAVPASATTPAPRPHDEELRA